MTIVSNSGFWSSKSGFGPTERRYENRAAGRAAAAPMAGKTAPGSCVFCGRCFDTQRELQEHFRKHANDKYGKSKDKESTTDTIKCEFCSQEFPSVSLAINHQFKKHNKIAVKHFCAWCGKQFPIKHTWQIHIKTHVNDAQVIDSKCEECDANFYTQAAFDTHQSFHNRKHKVYSNVITPPPSKKISINSFGDVQSVYYCHLCGQEYILKYNLQRHLESRHNSHRFGSTSEDLIKCTKCDALFHNDKAYRAHNMFHKPDDYYVTSEEMRANVVTKVDQDFDLRRVRPFLPNTGNKKIVIKTEEIAQKQEEISSKIGNTSSFSPPPSDSSDSETEKSENLNLVSTANSITLNDFINMHKDIFSDDAKERNDESNIHTNVIENLLEENTDELESNVSDINEAKNDNETVQKKECVKYITRDELKKLKCKGLIRITEPQKCLTNVKKVHIVESRGVNDDILEISDDENHSNDQLIKSEISNDILPESKDSHDLSRVIEINDDRNSDKKDINIDVQNNISIDEDLLTFTVKYDSKSTKHYFNKKTKNDVQKYVPIKIGGYDNLPAQFKNIIKHKNKDESSQHNDTKRRKV